MMTPRRRAEDGPRGFVAKLAATVVSALIVAAVGWIFAEVLNLANRVAFVEYYLKWKGILPP